MKCSPVRWLIKLPTEGALRSSSPTELSGLDRPSLARAYPDRGPSLLTGTTKVGSRTSLVHGESSRTCAAREPKPAHLVMKTGDPISPLGGYVGGGLQMQVDIALDPAGNVWVGNNWQLIDQCFATPPMRSCRRYAAAKE